MPTSTRGRDPAVEEEFQGALYKGGELLASGQIVEAREHLEKAHGLEPKNEKAQNLLGLAYFKLGLFDRASEVYEKLVNENPADATLRVNLGLVYLKTNNLERCIKEFEAATDLEPGHKKAHNYLGLALAQQGTYAQAKTHFELAGSDQMAEKMARAVAQAAPPPAPVVVPDSATPPAPAPHPMEEETIEVMSDEVELPPQETTTAETPVEVMHFAEPANASEEMPMLDAEVEATPQPAPEWLTTKAPRAEATWVTADVADVPKPADEWDDNTDAGIHPKPIESSWGEEVSRPTADESSWATAEAEPLPDPAAVQDAAWVNGSHPAQVPLAAEDPSWATGPAPETNLGSDAAWATGETSSIATAVAEETSQAQAPDDASWATGPSAEPSTKAAESVPFEDGPVEEVSMSEETYQAPEASAAGDEVPVADDASWATGSQPVEVSLSEESYQAPEASAAGGEVPVADDASWATGAQPVEVSLSEESYQAPEASAAGEVPVADDASWATGAQSVEVPTELATTPDDASWATGAEVPEPGPTAPGPAGGDTHWATEQVEGVPTPDGTHLEPIPEPTWETAEQPQEQWSEPVAPVPVEHVSDPNVIPAAPAGYAPMSPQRLVDLGASGSWVQEPTAGPFHISADGLAITIAGEMLARMMGLVAVVGSVTVTPENRRRRGRPTAETFGEGPEQLQRLSGNGVVYLESGRSKFHAVDLTDQNGVSIDDDGAYLREELVFAFEEPISFDNGKLTGDGLSLELAHLKGNGRVLLQLDGTLRAMPIPLGAPMVVPLHRVVGWFGRVTPRLVGFGGRGAVELTGEGYALLGSPAERS